MNEELEIDILLKVEIEIEVEIVEIVEDVIENIIDFEVLFDGELILFSEEIVQVVDLDFLKFFDEFNNGNYFEEEYYLEVFLFGNEGEQLLLLIEFFDDKFILSNWLKNFFSLLEVLKLSI